jgi:uncharacterized repeat protein (TIGR01451 family)
MKRVTSPVLQSFYLKITRIIPLFSLLFFNPSFSIAQGWERQYGTNVSHKGYYAHPTTDGGYILGASSVNAIYGFYDDMKIIKTNANGDTVWTRTFSDVDVDQGRNIQQTKDGGYIMVGKEKSAGLSHLTKLASDGTIEWRKTVGSWSINTASMYGYSIQQTADSGYIIAGQLAYVGGGSSDAFLVKTNSTGAATWQRTFRIAWLRNNSAHAVEQTPDGGYIIAGNSDDGGFIIKTDVDGYETWKKTMFEFRYSDLKPANNEPGYVLIGQRYPVITNSRAGCYFIKVKDNGDTLFTKFLGGRDTITVSSIDKTNDGGYCISGYTGPGSANDVLLIKIDKNGDTVWRRTFGGPYQDFGYSARQISDGNFIIAGTTTLNNGLTQAYLIKTDNLGNVLTNVITGNIFEEKNNNCQPDAGEKKLINAAYWKVKVTPGDKYAVPDSFGTYSVKVDTGAYQVNIINNHPYWQLNCPSSSSYAVSFNKFYDSAFNKNFGFKVKANCPLMWVDVVTGIVRPCRETTHAIRYCNNGTADANNVYLELTLDPALTFNSSIPAPAVQKGNVLRYNIGTVKAGECSTFNIATTVACTAVANSTVCVRAKIYPDSICTPAPSGWDKSSVNVTGSCTGNGVVRFVILNTGKAGEGDMKGASEYRIYVENAIVQTNTFQLKGGDSLVIQMDACGKTVRLEADQRPGHPGKSRPRATVEGCTGCGTATSTVGMRMAVAADDADATVEEECAIVRASFDPNEKLVSPAGITANRYVSSKDELEYRINFQNTGNDTAFLVILRDTLDTNVLDVSSLVPGIASHPYSFKIIGKGILEWTFKNILLPDSTTNEKASHGFVKFKINQVAGLSNGTGISNKAGIYFDFNAPVITSPVIVTVNDFVPHDAGNYNIVIINDKAYDSTVSVIKIVPHPLITKAVIVVQSPQVTTSDKLLLNIYDVTGRKVKSVLFTGRQTELKKESLAAGIYFLEIRKGSKRVITGKLLVE